MSMNTNIETPVEKKYTGYKVLVAICLAVCLAALFLPLGTFTSAWKLEQQSLIQTLPKLLESKAKVFGVLPALVDSSNAFLGAIATISLYVFVVTLAAAIIVAIVALFSGESTARRTGTAVFLFTLGSVVYALSIVCVSIFEGLSDSFDLYASVFAVVGILFSFVLMIVRQGKEAMLCAVQYLLSFASSGLLIFAIIHDGQATSQTMDSSATFKWILYAIFLLSVLNIVAASIRTLTKKGLGFDMVRYLMQLIISLLACYVSYAEEFSGSVYLSYAIIAALISLFQIVIANLQFERRSMEKVETAKEDTLVGFVVEQYLEAYPYDGGPVDTIEVAEEVNPTEAVEKGEKPDLASLVGNGFDPFLFTLEDEEKSEFIDLYILRCKALMPEIPGYVIGGNNKDFFNRVFIYLGQYRDKISNSLLQKMYDFSMKLS